MMKTNPVKVSSESNGKVISIAPFRELKEFSELESQTRKELLSLDKTALLDQMVAFQKERARAGKLTLPLIIRGRILFQALFEQSETRELKVLSRSYKKHLDIELSNHIRGSYEG